MNRDGYKTIGIQDSIYKDIESIVKTTDSKYRSVGEFVHEALRLRLEQLRAAGKKR